MLAPGRGLMLKLAKKVYLVRILGAVQILTMPVDFRIYPDEDTGGGEGSERN